MKLSRLLLILVLSMALAGLFTLSPTALNSAELEQIKKEYTFAVVPQGPPTLMNENWLPFIDRLSNDTGLKLQIKLYADIKAFEKDLREGKVDFAYMNPVQQIKVWRVNGYLPLVRSKKTIRGYIFVKKDTDIKNLDDLEGKEIALAGSENVCSIVIRHGIQARNVISRYVGSSENIYRNVELDETAAGGTLDIVFEQDLQKINQNFRILYSTEPINPHPISALPSVLQSVRSLVTETVLKYSQDTDAQDMLRRIGIPDPVKADYEQDYLALEQKLSEHSKEFAEK